MSLPGATCRRSALSAPLLALFLVSCGDRGASVKIGLAGPLTDPVGGPMKLAAELAAEEINGSGGIGGRKIVLVERDDHNDADSAIAIATDFYAAGVVAVVGDVSSTSTLAAAPVYNGGRNPVAQISPSSSSPELTDAGEYTFRVCPSDLAHGTELARWAHDHLRLGRGAVLYLNDDYGRGIRKTFVEEFIRLQGEVVETDPYLGDKPALGPYFDRLAGRQSAQFIMLAGNRSEAEEALRQARSRGLKVPFLGGDGLEGIEESGALAEGTYVSAAYLPGLETPKNLQFVHAYHQKYPSAGAPNQPAAATYDAIYLLRDVVSRKGLRRKAVRDGLAAVGTSAAAFEGVTGTIAFDQNGDVPAQRVIIGVVHNGAVQPAEGQ